MNQLKVSGLPVGSQEPSGGIVEGFAGALEGEKAHNSSRGSHIDCLIAAANPDPDSAGVDVGCPNGIALGTQDVQCVGFLHHFLERVHRGDPSFNKTIEERIIWGELLELELQEVDEQIERISEKSGPVSTRQTEMRKNKLSSQSK